LQVVCLACAALGHQNLDYDILFLTWSWLARLLHRQALIINSLGFPKFTGPG
jgi:hypothetical protein